MPGSDGTFAEPAPSRPWQPPQLRGNRARGRRRPRREWRGDAASDPSAAQGDEPRTRRRRFISRAGLPRRARSRAPSSSGTLRRRAGAPVDVVAAVRMVDGPVALVAVAEAAPAEVAPAAVVVPDHVVLAVGGVAAGADPGDRRHLGAGRARGLRCRRSSCTGSRRSRSAASTRSASDRPPGRRRLSAGAGPRGVAASAARDRQQRQRRARRRARAPSRARKLRRRRRRATRRAWRSIQRVEPLIASSCARSRLSAASRRYSCIEATPSRAASNRLSRCSRVLTSPFARSDAVARRSAPRREACRPGRRGRASVESTYGTRRGRRARRTRACSSRRRRRSRARGAPAALAARRARADGSSVLQTGQVGDTKKRSVARPLRVVAADAQRAPGEVGRRATTGAASPTFGPPRRMRARPTGATRSCSTPICRTSATTTAASTTTAIQSSTFETSKRLGHRAAPKRGRRGATRREGVRRRPRADRDAPAPPASVTASSQSERRAAVAGSGARERRRASTRVPHEQPPLERLRASRARRSRSRSSRRPRSEVDRDRGGVEREQRQRAASARRRPPARHGERARDSDLDERDDRRAPRTRSAGGQRPVAASTPRGTRRVAELVARGAGEQQREPARSDQLESGIRIVAAHGGTQEQRARDAGLVDVAQVRARRRVEHATAPKSPWRGEQQRRVVLRDRDASATPGFGRARGEQPVRPAAGVEPSAAAGTRAEARRRRSPARAACAPRS